MTKSTNAFSPDFINVEINATDLEYVSTVRCTGIRSLRGRFAEKTKARGATVVFLGLPLAASCVEEEVARF